MVQALDIAVVQIGELTEDVDHNLDRLVDAVEAATEGDVPDLVVLPELITAPYFCTSHDTDRTGWTQTIPRGGGDRTVRHHLTKARMCHRIRYLRADDGRNVPQLGRHRRRVGGRSSSGEPPRMVA